MGALASWRNRVIKEYRLLGSRKYRKKSGKVVLEGYHLLNEALNAGIMIEAVVCSEDYSRKKMHKELLDRVGEGILVKVAPRTFNSIAHTETPQGIGAIALLPRFGEDFLDRENVFLLILDGVQDPGNVGTIIRSAAAAGVDGVLCFPGTAETGNPKVLRAAMGGLFYLPVIQCQKTEGMLGMLKEKGVRLVAADPGAELPYYRIDYSAACAVVIGNESSGISGPVMERVDMKACIPLKGRILSLNAGVAASVIIFEGQRQRSIIACR